MKFLFIFILSLFAVPSWAQPTETQIPLPIFCPAEVDCTDSNLNSCFITDSNYSVNDWEIQADEAYPKIKPGRYYFEGARAFGLNRKASSNNKVICEYHGSSILQTVYRHSQNIRAYSPHDALHTIFEWYGGDQNQPLGCSKLPNHNYLKPSDCPFIEVPLE